MKHIIPIRFLAVVMLVMLSACSDKENEGLKTPKRPTDWVSMTAETHNLGLSSMMITVQTTDLPDEWCNNEDMLAAFVDDECRVVVQSAITDQGMQWLMLNVPSLVSDEDKSDVLIELRYYSSKQEKVFKAKPLSYKADSWEGSVVSGGYEPEWIQ